MERIKWSEKVTNEQVLECIGEKRMLLNNILRKKANWIGEILASFMMPLKDRWWKWKEWEKEEEHRSLMIWEIEEDIKIKGKPGKV